MTDTPARPMLRPAFRAFLARGTVQAPRPAHARELLNWLSELCWLTEAEGCATPAAWHRRVRTDLSRASSNRQFERLKRILVDHGVPHDRVEVEARDESGEPLGEFMIGLRLKVARTGLEKYLVPLKACARKACGARHPARPPFFHRNRANADGLDRLCAECRRAKEQHRDRRAARGYWSSPAGRDAKRRLNARSSAREARRKWRRRKRQERWKASGHRAGVVSWGQQFFGGSMFTPSKPSTSSASTTDPIKTSRSVARELAISMRQLEYLLLCEPSLDPPLVSGRRLFSTAQVDAIRRALEERRAKKLAQAQQASTPKAAS